MPGIEVTIDSGENPLAKYNDDQAEQTIGTDANICDGEKEAYYVERIGQDFTFGLNITNKYKPSSPSLAFVVYNNHQYQFCRKIKLPKIVNNPIWSIVSNLWCDGEARGIKEPRAFHFIGFKISGFACGIDIGMHDYPHAAENEALKKTLDKEIETMKRTGKIVDRVYGTEEHEIMVVSAKAKPTTNLADVHKVERELPKEVHEKALKGNAKSFGMA